MTLRECRRCWRVFTPAAEHHRLCWECWRQERDTKHDAGTYAAGYRDGRRAATVISDELLRDAIALCHPDRHPPERHEQANRVTAALLDLLRGARKAA